MITFSVQKTFASRDELDAYVRNTFGDNIENNAGITLSGNEQALQDLSISESTKVFGVKVVLQNNG